MSLFTTSSRVSQRRTERRTIQKYANAVLKTKHARKMWSRREEEEEEATLRNGHSNADVVARSMMMTMMCRML